MPAFSVFFLAGKESGHVSGELSQGSGGGVNSAIQAKSLATLNRFRNSMPGINRHILTDKDRSILLLLRLLEILYVHILQTDDMIYDLG